MIETKNDYKMHFFEMRLNSSSVRWLFGENTGTKDAGDALIITLQFLYFEVKIICQITA